MEQDLWNNCFKSQISNLQSAAKDKRSSKAAAEASMTLNWFLEMASGFYILLLEDVKQTFSVPLPFFQSADPYGIWSNNSLKVLNTCMDCRVQVHDCTMYSL